MKRILFASVSMLAVLADVVWSAILVPIAPVQTTKDSPAAEVVETIRQGKRNAALALALPLAEKGDADALFLVGYLKETQELLRPTLVDSLDYYYRKADEAGHPEAKFRRWLVVDIVGRRNRNEAVENLTKAAEESGSPATRILGEAWLRGMIDGKPNPDLAKQLWERAGAAGDAAALHLLGELYGGAYGKSIVPVDQAAAAGYYRQAVKLGFADSYAPLCRILLMGEGSARNVEEGHQWAETGISKGVHALHVVRADYEEQVNKDGKVSLDRLRSGAEAGHLESMFRLANALLPGGDKEEGSRWLIKAADAGFPKAAAQLGDSLLPTDAAKAYDYLLVAGNEGVHQAQFLLGKIYLEGKMGPPDPKAAIPWFTEAMSSGDGEMQYQIGYLNEKGIGCQMNYANAAVLYNLATGKGNMKAAARVAYMAAEGLGMKRNLPQAWAYASLAVKSGDESLKPFLAKVEKEMNQNEQETAKITLATMLSGKPPEPPSDEDE